MDELFEIADEVSVLRDGRYIGTASPLDLTRDELIRMMVGRELSQGFPSARARPGAVVLSARDLTLAPQFYDIGFDLRAGEILGIAGLIGAGRSQLAEALFGLTPASSGRVWIQGCEVKLDSPQAARSHGMAFVTEDRKDTGCFLRLSVLENLQIAVLEGDFVRCGFVRSRAVTQACAAMSRAPGGQTADLHERIERSEERRVGKECRSRWSPYH